MQAAIDQAFSDLAGRQEPHLGVQPFDLGGVATLAANLAERMAEAGKPGFRLFLEAPLGRDRNRQPGHAPSLRTRTIRSGRTTPADASG
jgi:hypothetical protein